MKGEDGVEVWDDEYCLAEGNGGIYIYNPTQSKRSEANA